MGRGCTQWAFERRVNDGLKRLTFWLPEDLQRIRQDTLYEARNLRWAPPVDEVPHREFEAALIQGTWRNALKSLDPLRSSGKEGLRRDTLYVYNQTLWEMETWMKSLMVGGQLGPVRMFYNALEREI